METRANHILIGGVVLTISVLFVTFIIWFSSIELNEKQTEYLILFEGSVTGLRVNEPVRYQGIPIGEVREIGVDPQNIDLVRVRVAIDDPALIRENSLASLEAQGLTGYTFVEIRAGDDPGPMLKAKPGESYPIIPSRPSNLEILFSKAPQILESLFQTLEGAKKLLNDESRKDFSETLSNLRSITQKLDKGSNSLESAIHDFRETFKSVKSAADKLDNHADQALMNVSDAAFSVKESTAQFNETIFTFQHILKDNQESIKNFTNSGLKDFSKFITEARDTVNSFTQIARQLERSPSAFLNKGTDNGYKIQ